MTTTTKWDMADSIETPEEAATYLEAALEENDPEFLLAVLGDIARSKGMTRIARDTGLSRESLYRSLSPSGNPSFITVMKVLQSMGLHLRIVAP